MSLFNFFDEIYPEKDGAMQASRMSFILSIPEGKGKKLTRRGAWILVAAVTVVLVLVLAVSTWLGADGPRQIYEHMELLQASIGQTQDEVYDTLAAKGAGLVEVTPGCYAIPGGGELAGVEFAILLHFEENQGLLDGFEYVTNVKLESKEAAHVIKDLLGEHYADPVTLTDGQKIPLESKLLTDLLSGSEPIALQLSADITPEPEYATAVTQYITHLEAADYWEGRSGEYLIKTANYYRDIDVRYTPQTQTLFFHISYTVEADRD